MENFGQLTGDSGTVGVAELKPDRNASASPSETAAGKNTLTQSRDLNSPFEKPAQIFDSEPLERVLDTKSGDLAGTVVNLAAAALARGEKVLFVSSNAERQRAVVTGLHSAGLAETALSIDASDSRKIGDELRQTLRLGPPVEEDRHQPRKQLETLTGKLNSHAEALSAEIRDSGVSGYEAVSTLLTLGTNLARSIDFSPLGMRDWSGVMFESALKTATDLDDCLRDGGYPHQNPWRGAAVNANQVPPAEENLQQALRKLTDASRETASFLNDLGFDSNISENDADKILQALSIIDSLETDNGAAIKGINLRCTATWTKDREKIVEALQNELQIAEFARKLHGKADFERLRKVDLTFAARAISAYQEKNAITRLFDADYPKALKSLERVAAMPERVEDVARIVGHLDTVQKMLYRADENKALWEKLFPEQDENAADDLTLWRRRAQLSYAVMDLFTLGDSLSDADSKSLLTQLKNPEALYSHSVKLQEVRSLVTDYKKLRNAAGEQLGLGDRDLERSFYSKPLAEQEKRLQEMCTGTQSWLAWQRFAKVAESAKAGGLGILVDQVLEGTLYRPIFASALKQAWFKSLAEEFVASRSGTALPGNEQTELARNLLEADANVRTENAELAAKKHWDTSPRYIVGGQSAALYNLISDEARRPALEDIFKKAGRAVQQAKPFVLTDLGSAAQLATLSPLRFDLVILDENAAIPFDHPLRTQAAVAKVVQITSNAAAATPSRNGSELAQIDQSTALSRADWRLSASSAAAPRDLFQSALKKILENDLHLVVHTDVKTPKGTIDIAVMDPSNPKTYALGIVLDGLNYQSGQSALEREKTRNEACAELCARPLQYAWILDWAKNPEGSKKEFVAAITKALRQPGVESNEASDRIIPRDALQAEHLSLFKPYQKASLDLPLLKILQRYHGDMKPVEVAEALKQIVDQEGPIHRDELSQRFLQFCGARTLSEAMHLQIVEGEQFALKHKKLLVRDDFLYSPEPDQTIYPRSRGELPGTLARFERIAGEELEAAICLVVKNAYGINRKELPAQLFRAFGYKGVPFGADTITEREVSDLLKAKVLREQDGILSLGEKCRLT